MAIKLRDVNAYLSNYSLGSADLFQCSRRRRHQHRRLRRHRGRAGYGGCLRHRAGGRPEDLHRSQHYQGVNDTYNKIVTDDIAKTSARAGACANQLSGTSELAAARYHLPGGRAQGQAIFAAAGDAGAYDCGITNWASITPADDPNVVGVGGTTLNTGTAAPSPANGLVMHHCTSEGPKGAGGGGGLSTYFAQPSYQSGHGVSNRVSNGKREVPDVSADADPNTGYSVYCTVTAAGCSSSSLWTVVGGTSAAAPLWTALTGGYQSVSVRV